MSDPPSIGTSLGALLGGLALMTLCLLLAFNYRDCLLRSTRRVWKSRQRLPAGRFGHRSEREILRDHRRVALGGLLMGVFLTCVGLVELVS